MNLGKKLFELRKSKHLSQEQVAERLNVTRQTVSNWELEETSPDLHQAKELAKLFEVSLDELVGFDSKNILTQKVSNVEKLAGIILTILKVLGILFILYLIFMVIAIFCFSSFKTTTTNQVSEDFSCTLENQTYTISKDSKNNISCPECSDSFLNELKSLETLENIEEYFLNHQGSCN